MMVPYRGCNYKRRLMDAAVATIYWKKRLIIAQLTQSDDAANSLKEKLQKQDIK